MCHQDIIYLPWQNCRWHSRCLLRLVGLFSSAWCLREQRFWVNPGENSVPFPMRRIPMQVVGRWVARRPLFRRPIFLQPVHLIRAISIHVHHSAPPEAFRRPLVRVGTQLIVTNLITRILSCFRRAPPGLAASRRALGSPLPHCWFVQWVYLPNMESTMGRFLVDCPKGCVE